MTLRSQVDLDQRTRKLHTDAGTHWPKLEAIIDKLESLGPNSLDGDNAVANVRDSLAQLSRR